MVVDEFVLLSIEEVGGSPVLRAHVAGGVEVSRVPGRELGVTSSAADLAEMLGWVDRWVKAATDPSYSRDDVLALRRTSSALFDAGRFNPNLPTLTLQSEERRPPRLLGECFDALSFTLSGSIDDLVMEVCRPARSDAGGWGLARSSITGGGVGDEAGRRRFAERALEELRALLPAGYRDAYEASLVEAAAYYDGRYGVSRRLPDQRYDPAYDLAAVKAQVAERFGGRVTFLRTVEDPDETTRVMWGLDPVLAVPLPEGSERAVRMTMRFVPSREELRAGVTLGNGIRADWIFWQRIPLGHNAETVAYKLDMIDRYVQLLLGEEE